MSFKETMIKLRETGFKNFEAVEYFVKFAESEGSTVSELTTNRNDYHRAHRQFKIMSDGYKQQVGLELFESPVTERSQCIQLTDKGMSLFQSIRGV